MNVLILGSGGREHALAWKIAQSPELTKLYVAPGNGGTDQMGVNVSLSPTDFPAVADFVRERAIDLLVVGPEEPLVKGIHDYLADEAGLHELHIIGPRRAGAELEGSKAFSKEFMKTYEVPTARYQAFTMDTLDAGKDFLTTLSSPYVLKADGLAAGKGVLILDDLETAQQELETMLSGKFGAASSQVVIEEFLQGIELSVFVLTDGTSYMVLPEAKDYKRIGEGDTGLNTGGMGAVSPVPFASDEFLEKVRSRIVEPTLSGLQAEGIPYTGFLFIGLMNVDGDPYVIEYNVRMGDPETEVVIPRIQSDLLTLLRACGEGTLGDEVLHVDPQTATTVMLVSGGYPEGYEKGKVMTGLDQVAGSIPFHAGTRMNDDELTTSGGRVLALTSLGDSIAEALQRSYTNAAQVQFDGRYYRTDIGFDLVDQ